MADKHMPKRIYAFRYHPDNQRDRSRGAWDDRKSLILKDDVAYIRADEARAWEELALSNAAAAQSHVERWARAEAALRLALPALRRELHGYLECCTVARDVATVTPDEWEELAPDIAAIRAAAAIVGPQPDAEGVDSAWLDAAIARAP